MSMRLPENGSSAPIQPENQSFISKMKQKAESKIGRNFKAELSEKLQNLANNVKNSKVGELFSSPHSPLRLAFTNAKAIGKASFDLAKGKLQSKNKTETTRRNSEALSKTTRANPEIDKNFSHLEGLVDQKIRLGKFAEAKVAILEVQLENDDPEVNKKLEGLLNKVQVASGEQTSPEPVESFPVYASLYDSSSIGQDEQEPATLLFESIHEDGEEFEISTDKESDKTVDLDDDEDIKALYERKPQFKKDELEYQFSEIEASVNEKLKQNDINGAREEVLNAILESDDKAFEKKLYDLLKGIDTTQDF